MTQEAFAPTIGVPAATARNWEQSRTGMDPAVRSLPRIVEREPGAVMRALAGQRIGRFSLDALAGSAERADLD